VESVKSKTDNLQFEQSIANILETQGEVSRKQFTESDPPLLIVSVRALGKDRHVAVKSKVSVSSLADLQELYSHLAPLLASDSVDELLLVTENPLSVHLDTAVKRLPGLRHATRLELLQETIDFRPYLRSIVSAWRDRPDHLQHYYVRLRTPKREDLEDLVRNWLAGSNSQPIAILGSYGMGKSVFAAKLAHDLAVTHASDPTSRIPIVIRLGEIVFEQSLEGLLGRALTAGIAVRNFSFETFQQLNRAGRLIIILDGFDEMKRGMTWESFRYNLGELNRLVIGESRVILLGRPTAFLNDDEYKYALHGQRLMAGHFISEPGWPDYREVNIALLRRPQIDECVAHYLRHQADIKGERNRFRVEQQTGRLIQQVHDPNIRDISSRPVQLHMLLAVLPSWRRSLRELGIANLYDNFINQNIEREAQRPGRGRYTTRQRRRFARDLAWWMWRQPQSGFAISSIRINAEAIPDEIIATFSDPGEDLDIPRRDLVAACFLDRRFGGDLVFPHRSFQEYLVADYISDTISRTEVKLGELAPHITEEVSDFLTEIIGSNPPDHLDKSLQDFVGTLPWRVLRLWGNSPSQEAEVKRRAWQLHFTSDDDQEFGDDLESPPWWTLVFTIAYLKGTFKESPVSLLESGLSSAETLSMDAALYFVCLLLIAGRRKDSALAIRALNRACKVGRYRSTDSDELLTGPHRVLSRSRVRRDYGGTESLEIFEPSVPLMLAISHVAAGTIRGTRVLDVRGAFAPLLEAIKGHCSLDELHNRAALDRLGLELPSSFVPSDWSFWTEVSRYRGDFERWSRGEVAR